MATAPPAANKELAADATRLLYERHRQRILAFCLNRLGNRQEAEDALQTTFLYVFRNLQRGVVPRNEVPWLYTIAANACRARRRSLWRRHKLEASVDPDTLHDVLDDAGDRRDELAGIGPALASLPANQRRALLLREWQGLSYREIADALSLSQSAVETLLFRARRTLAQKLREGLEQAALAFNAIPLVRLIRRLGHAGAGTKTAATLVALSVAAGTGGRVLEQRLRHHPASRANDASPLPASEPSGAQPILGTAPPASPARKGGGGRPAAALVSATAGHPSPAPNPPPHEGPAREGAAGGTTASGSPAGAPPAEPAPQGPAQGAPRSLPPLPATPKPVRIELPPLPRLPRLPKLPPAPEPPPLPAPPQLPGAGLPTDQPIDATVPDTSDVVPAKTTPNVTLPSIHVPPTEDAPSLPTR